MTTTPLLSSAEETANDWKSSRTLLLLVLSTTKAVCEASKPQTSEQLVDAQSTEKTVDKSSKAKSAEELANQAKDTGQQ